MMRDRPLQSTEAGFSLMEAIVAVAILGVASVPLLMLQSQNARSVMRLEASAERISAERVVADYLFTIDLTSASEGQIDIGGGWLVSWRAIASSEPTNTIISVGNAGRFSAQLMRIDALTRHYSGMNFSSHIYRTTSIEASPFQALQ